MKGVFALCKQHTFYNIDVSDMENIYEVQRIKQIRTEMEVKENNIRMPENAADIARSFIGDDDREVLLVLCLNTKNKVVAVHRAHIGLLNASGYTSKGSDESYHT